MLKASETVFSYRLNAAWDNVLRFSLTDKKHKQVRTTIDDYVVCFSADVASDCLSK